ncbi:TPA: DUF2076 domain-containing protein, partial [Candidatus Uhrbacteria bacterium]|nr:DUF2076 domain-containing protein [Candidatus Uhrbacteria bacterium]
APPSAPPPDSKWHWQAPGSGPSGWLPARPWAWEPDNRNGSQRSRGLPRWRSLAAGVP